MSHIVSVGGSRFLAGLYWTRFQSIHKRGKAFKSEMDGAVYEYQQIFDAQPTVGVLHSTGIDLLMGVGERAPENTKSGDKGKNRKEHSLVCLALLANPAKRSFVGRLRLSEGYEWIVVVRSGIVSPIGDQVIEVDDADEALSAIRARNVDLEILFNERSIDTSLQLIESWHAEVSSRKVPDVRDIKSLALPILSKKKLLVYWFIGATLLGGIYVGYSQYQSYVVEKELQAEAARQAALGGQGVRPPTPKPWEDWPRVGDVASTCWANFETRDEYKLGWEEVYWWCDGSTVLQNWRRTETGTYTFLPVEGGFNITKPNEISHREDINVDSEPRGTQAIPPKQEVAKILMDAARIHGLGISLKWGDEATRTYTQGGDKKVEHLGYSLNKSTLSGKSLEGLSVVNVFRDIPGLRLKSFSKEGREIKIVIEFYTATI